MPRTLPLMALLLAAATARADDPAAAEFFEKRVRPLLVERCQGCHGADKSKGDLRLDSRAAMLAGGGNGPAAVPGKPADSLIIDAVNYGDLVQMPPKSKLDAAEIATLTKWVEMGAPWPGVDASNPVAAGSKGFNLKERARHWSFQPIKDLGPPAVGDASWPATPIDRFLLVELEKAQLKPAPDADRRTLIRRATFDLTGLPPTPAEVAAFLGDATPRAFEEVVDRLLASTAYGERWGRHWLDLVRYAETGGHEFDYDIPLAYKYRDYVIRAFNADLPFDQFLVEHLAGDLLDAPRRDAQGLNVSAVGTAFALLGEGTHSPVDVREDEVARIDNQIDVTAKTFLGLTVSCARCHDHKFDAITTKDYYALAGYFQSSRAALAFLDPPSKLAPKLDALASIKAELKKVLAAPSADPRVAAYLLACREVVVAPVKNLALVAHAHGLDEGTLGRWSDALRGPVSRSPANPLQGWDVPGKPDPAAGSELLESFDRPTYEGWFPAGDAFGGGPTRPGDLVVRDGKSASMLAPGVAHSGAVSERLQGVLRSKTFVITRRYLDYLAAGRGGRIKVIVDGFEKIRDPIYGALTLAVDSPEPRWHRQDLSMWVGHTAHIELADGATILYEGQTSLAPGGGFLAVDEIRQADAGNPPGRVPRLIDAATPEEWATQVEKAVIQALRRWRAGVPVEAEAATLLAWLVDRGLVPLGTGPEVDALIANYAAAEAKIAEPTLAPALVDGNGEDEHVMIRGSHKNPGDLVPRRFLEAIAGPDQPSAGTGSGRLELARKLVDPANPLTARVLVNRLWKHHFGEGIVKSTDDFGVMGQPPTHPALLDYLATELVRGGWSIKRMQRSMMLSHVYRMASRSTPDADLADPTNRLLHRMNARRLEAEALRDAILSASGRLDRTMYGPSVPTHLTAFMEGRGRPGASGPLDGDGRRGIYLNIRRNFLDPMLLAFDYPSPASTVGRRNVSNVPAQALTLLNDPFVVGQAKLWADRSLREVAGTAGERVESLYLTAFSRPPTAVERDDAIAFLDGQSALYGRPDDPRAWADLCHVLINVKEFLYVN